MNKKTLSIIVVIIVVIGGGIFYLLNNSASNPTTESKQSEKSKSTDKPIVADEQQTLVAGSYIDYSSTVIADTAGTKLLFFHASWCSKCRAIENDIKAKGVPSGVAIIKVDYDSNQSLRQKYGVTLQTTFVRVDDEGTFVKKFVANEDPTLNSVKANLLN